MGLGSGAASGVQLPRSTYELNVAALLRRRAIFVPGIYATSALTIALGHAYGMPKQPTRMSRQRAGRWVRSRVGDGSRQSYIQARLLGSGRLLGWLAGRFWPWRAWPAWFPSGTRVRVLVQTTPRVQAGRVRAGRLSLPAPWLPEPVALLPSAAYLPGQRMQLPPLADLRPAAISQPVGRSQLARTSNGRLRDRCTWRNAAPGQCDE